MLKDLQAYSVQISNDIKDSVWKSLHALMVPALLHLLRLIRNAWQLDCERFQRTAQHSNRGQANMERVQQRFAERSLDWKGWDIMYERTGQRTEKLEDLLRNGSLYLVRSVPGSFSS